MPYGLDLSTLEDEKLDIAGYPKYPIKRQPIDFGSFGTGHTTYNSYVAPGTVEDVGAGALIPLRGTPSNLEKQASRYAADIESRILSNKTSTRRGLDFDFTSKMPELPTSPITPLPATSTVSTSATPSTPEFVQSVVSPNKKSSFTDWWGKMEPDRKQALTRGLLATGLNMMSLGGRTYDRPVSALGIAGEAGKAGLSQYEDTYDREQAHKLRKEYYGLAKEGLKLKSDIYKGKALSGMSASQDREYKRHLDSQKDIVQMIVPADASFWGGFFAADSEKQGEMLASNPGKAEKLREALAKPGNAAYRDRYMISKKYTDNILYGRDMEQGTRATGLNLSPESAEQTKKEWELYE